MSGEISGIEITRTSVRDLRLHRDRERDDLPDPGAQAPMARWSNIVLAIVYIVSIIAAAIGEDAYYLFLSAIEVAMLLLIVGYAWTWPRQSS